MRALQATRTMIKACLVRRLDVATTSVVTSQVKQTSDASDCSGAHRRGRCQEDLDPVACREDVTPRDGGTMNRVRASLPYLLKLPIAVVLASAGLVNLAAPAGAQPTPITTCSFAAFQTAWTTSMSQSPPGEVQFQVDCTLTPI